MKNPDKIRALTDNFCILDAALAGFSYAFIAKYYNVSSTRVAQILSSLVRRLAKVDNRLYGLHMNKGALNDNKDVIIAALTDYYNNSVTVYVLAEIECRIKRADYE